MFAYTLTSNSINLYIRGKSRTVDKTHANYDAIREKLKTKPVVPSGSWLAGLDDLIDVRSFVAKVTEGRVQVSEDNVHIAGKPAPAYAGERVLEMLREGFDIKPLCRFLDKLHDNPTEDVKTDLYKWLEAAQMPLTEDGDFLAYKYVNSNYTSHHGFKNPVGEPVSMPREECDDDRNKTCSRGLHFASWDYVWNTGSRKLVLKVNPRDVVAIPTDYNNHKGRACKYFILEEVTEEQKFNSVVSSFGAYEEPLEEVTEVDPDRAGEHFGVEEETTEDVAGSELEPTPIPKYPAPPYDLLLNENHRETRPALRPAGRPDRPQIVINEKTGEPTFKAPNGVAWKSKLLLADVSRLNQRQFARDNDVPRTTLQGWVRRAEAWLAKKGKKGKK